MSGIELWGQPVLPQFRESRHSPRAAWLYAISQRLEPQRDRDKLTFHLTGLRPGKLRIIANFDPHPHHVSHSYTRRDPQGNDIVVEIDVKESISGLIVTPEGQKEPDKGDNN
jgi:hypothetical protein